MVVLAQDNDRQLTLTVGSGPTYKLHPYQNRTFVIDKLEGFRVEFHLGPDGEVDGLIFHQPNGTFVAPLRRSRRLAWRKIKKLRLPPIAKGRLCACRNALSRSAENLG
jgi:hypothetical protein